MGLFNGISHAIIRFNIASGIQATGIYAMMTLCFGKDTDAIAQVLYRTSGRNKTPMWVLPTRLSSDNQTRCPVFAGRVGEEVLVSVGSFADIFKRHYKESDGPKVGRSWRISQNVIVEITEQEATTKS